MWRRSCWLAAKLKDVNDSIQSGEYSMWQVDVAKNTLTAILPFQNTLRRCKRRVRRQHTLNASSTVSGAFDHIDALKEAGVSINGATILEVGSGWFPVVPLILRIAGAGHVVMTDVHNLMDADLVRHTARFLSERSAEISERLGLPEHLVKQRLAVAEDDAFDDVLEALGLSYHTPFDYAANTATIDVICSHTVLEHISPDILEQLYGDWKLALKPGGVLCHGIDHSDHRANKDTVLSRIDFLRYSDTVWKFLCIHPQDYTNRLRHPDYIEAIQAAGYELITNRPMVNQACLTELADLKLNARFAEYSDEDIATLWTQVVARPK